MKVPSLIILIFGCTFMEIKSSPVLHFNSSVVSHQNKEDVMVVLPISSKTNSSLEELYTSAPVTQFVVGRDVPANHRPGKPLRRRRTRKPVSSTTPISLEKENLEITTTTESAVSTSSTYLPNDSPLTSRLIQQLNKRKRKPVSNKENNTMLISVGSKQEIKSPWAAIPSNFPTNFGVNIPQNLTGYFEPSVEAVPIPFKPLKMYVTPVPETSTLGYQEAANILGMHEMFSSLGLFPSKQEKSPISSISLQKPRPREPPLLQTPANTDPLSYSQFKPMPSTQESVANDMADLLAAFGLLGEEESHERRHVFNPARHRVEVKDNPQLNAALSTLAKWSAEGDAAISQREMRELNNTFQIKETTTTNEPIEETTTSDPLFQLADFIQNQLSNNIRKERQVSATATASASASASASSFASGSASSSSSSSSQSNDEATKIQLPIQFIQEETSLLQEIPSSSSTTTEEATPSSTSSEEPTTSSSTTFEEPTASSSTTFEESTASSSTTFEEPTASSSNTTEEPTTTTESTTTSTTSEEPSTTSTSTTTTEEPARTPSVSDLADSFGGGDTPTEEEEAQLPPPRPSGLYFLLDWNSFLEVDDGGSRSVKIRFSPKVGDPSRFVNVKVP